MNSIFRQVLEEVSVKKVANKKYFIVSCSDGTIQNKNYTDALQRYKDLTGKDYNEEKINTPSYHNFRENGSSAGIFSIKSMKQIKATGMIISFVADFKVNDINFDLINKELIVDIRLNETDAYDTNINKDGNLYDVFFKRFISILSFTEKKIFLKEINEGQSFYRNSIILKYFGSDVDNGFKTLNFWHSVGGKNVHWIDALINKNGYYHSTHGNKYDSIEFREFCDVDETWFLKCRDASVDIIKNQISLAKDTVDKVFNEIEEFEEFEKLVSEKFPEIDKMDIPEFKKFIYTEKGENGEK